VAISGGEKWGKVCRGDCAVANVRLTF
jgi:hypothetical protein